MKLLFTVTFLASLAFGSASNSKLGKNNHASNRDDEDFEYWRNLVDTVGSMTTNAPTKSPVDSPTPPPVTDPTSAPVATTLAPSAPSTEVCKPIGTCYYNARYKISTTPIKIRIEGYVMFLSFLKLSYPFCILRLYISFLI